MSNSSTSSEKVLLVEGKDDLYAVQALMKHHVAWESDNHPVEIIDMGGDENILRSDIISVQAKTAGLKTLGILLDADTCNAQSRWQSIRQSCQKSRIYPELPEELPVEGLIHKESDSSRFGVWVMPNNQDEGMLETFLSSLVFDAKGELLTLAQESVAAAKNLDAPFKENHKSKAVLHTYLSWQNPPGKPFGQVLKAGKSLDPFAPAAKPFVNWFIELFELTRKKPVR